jgi:hypothetical protein
MDIINCNHENSDSSDSDDYGYFTAVENKMTKLDSMTEDDIADWFFFSTVTKNWPVTAPGSQGVFGA